MTRKGSEAMANDLRIGEEEEEEVQLLSWCCGAPEHDLIDNFCSACKEFTGFEEEES